MRQGEITPIEAEALQIAVESEEEGTQECEGMREGGAVHKQEVGREGGRKRERGKEKTRLPQHDLQIALSPWRLLSALSLRSKVVQTAVPQSGADSGEGYSHTEGGGRKKE